MVVLGLAHGALGLRLGHGQAREAGPRSPTCRGSAYPAPRRQLGVIRGASQARWARLWRGGAEEHGKGDALDHRRPARKSGREAAFGHCGGRTEEAAVGAALEFPPNQFPSCRVHAMIWALQKAGDRAGGRAIASPQACSGGAAGERPAGGDASPIDESDAEGDGGEVCHGGFSFGAGCRRLPDLLAGCSAHSQQRARRVPDEQFAVADIAGEHGV